MSVSTTDGDASAVVLYSFEIVGPYERVPIVIAEFASVSVSSIHVMGFGKIASGPLMTASWRLSCNSTASVAAWFLWLPNGKVLCLPAAMVRRCPYIRNI